MYETMYNAEGVGLAAPQIGLPIRVFLVDTSPFAEDESLSDDEREKLRNFKCTFINAKLVTEEGNEWVFNEGCLSIPNIREDVYRKPNIKIQFQDENFKNHSLECEGLLARVIQHEYDHIEGILFTEYLSPLRKRMIKRRLSDIMNGKINPEYRMRFYKAKKGRR